MTDTTWPAQLSLPGQSHVADGPYDQSGMYLMHHAFRRDLRRFEAAVRNTPLGEAAVWRSLAERWGRFAEVLHHHHRIEDEHIWPVLMRHARTGGDARACVTLTDMEAEHEQIDPALAACASGLADMVAHPCGAHRDALDGSVTAVRSALTQHLRHEETEALPLLQRVMTAEEYRTVELAATKGYPRRVMPFLVPWVTAGLPDDVLAALLARIGLPYRLALRVFGGRFERSDALAFRYA